MYRMKTLRLGESDFQVRPISKVLRITCFSYTKLGASLVRLSQ